MLFPHKTTQFQKDERKAKKQNKNMGLLRDVIKDIIEEKVLKPQHKDHPLQGRWTGCRDCHVQNDWVLIYRVNKLNKSVFFERIGSHSELFD